VIPWLALGRLSQWTLMASVTLARFLSMLAVTVTGCGKGVKWPEPRGRSGGSA
jgi:hypothetical protein